MSPGPGSTSLPLGVRVALERRARVVDGGAVLLGGAPPRMLFLSAAARTLVTSRGASIVTGARSRAAARTLVTSRGASIVTGARSRAAARTLLIGGGAFTVTDATSRTLARTLLDAGIAHIVDVPPAAAPTRADVTVVVPVKDRVAGLERLLAVVGPAVVVDDGSADPAAIRAVAERAGGRVVRHATSRGPAAARNAGLAVATTPFVAFLDSDVVPEQGWLEPLLAQFADPAVGLAAPRIVALDPGTGWLQSYEAVRSSLDLGPDPALVVPRTRVAYVPSAALLVRRAAVGAGFDEALHVAEDVDLVLRMHAAGWRLRYEPSSRVAHEHRTDVRAWWLRKAFYGTGAAPLALRHKGSVPPMVLSPWSAAVGVLVVAGRPLAAVAVSAAAAERLSRKLQRVEHPRATAARLIGLGAMGAIAQTADAVTRHYWPVAALACLVSRRARRTVAVVAVAEGVVDFARRRGSDPRVRPRLPGYLLVHRLDDLAYGAGLWWGAWRHRTTAPLRPGAVRQG